MRTALHIALVVVGLLGLAVLGARLYFEKVANPRVVREIREEPGGERARKVMLLTLPSGRHIPVNYLRIDDRVYAGADGRWWKELAEGEAPVELTIRGEELRGTARAVLDDPAYTEKIFAQLRPNAVKGFGTLVEIRLSPPATP